MNRMDKAWTGVGRVLTDWRLLGAVFVLAIAVALLVSLDASDAARRAIKDTRRQTLAQANESQVNDYDQQVDLHDACLRDNDSRRRDRTLFLNLYDLAAAAPPAVPRTPAEQKFLDDFLAAARLDVVNQTPPLDCDAESPRPNGLRPS